MKHLKSVNQRNKRVIFVHQKRKVQHLLLINHLTKLWIFHNQMMNQELKVKKMVDNDKQHHHHLQILPAYRKLLHP